MESPNELSFDEILKFMLAHNGRVTNHVIVKHFKAFLTNPVMRDEARNKFKEYVNTLAIIKNENNEKLLILKKKYMPNKETNGDIDVNMATVASTCVELPIATESNVQLPDKRHPLPVQLNQDLSILNNLVQDQQNINILPMTNSPYESKESLFALPLEDVSHNAHTNSIQDQQNLKHLPMKHSLYESRGSLSANLPEDVPPKVHPRRKSSDKALAERRSQVFKEPEDAKPVVITKLIQDVKESDNIAMPTLTTSRSESMLLDNEQKISVKERKQMFNRMASESDVLKTNRIGGNFSTQGVDEEDRVSLDQKSESDPLDSKQKQWILCAARGEYHTLAKMCKESPKLAKTKTAMHWACKRGDGNLVKLLAGAARHLVNERSNGGYTPLHIAMQFHHENVYRLLVEVYDADSNVRDWSGRKPMQYLFHIDTSLSPGSIRKKEGFLRFGSLNVRVKKTTEAFSNFLGVGATRSSAYIPKRAKDREERRSDDGELLKTWGSADNIQKEDKLMPPPTGNKVRRRGASGRKGLHAHSRSTPSTPDQPRAQIGVSEEGDSDSDSAAGFHAAWKQQRASNYT
ncbi:hypothetical protein ACJJTC_000887 [Scirpophaga incertulas]